MPKRFGFKGQLPAAAKLPLARVDLLGSVLLFFAVVLLTAGFEEAGSEFSWNSAYVITMLILAGLFWIALLLWEYRVTAQSALREPVLPWRFFTNRVMVGAIL